MVAALVDIWFKAAFKKIKYIYFLILKPPLRPAFLGCVASLGKAVQDLSPVTGSLLLDT